MAFRGRGTWRSFMSDEYIHSWRAHWEGGDLKWVCFKHGMQMLHLFIVTICHPLSSAFHSFLISFSFDFLSVWFSLQRRRRKLPECHRQSKICPTQLRWVQITIMNTSKRWQEGSN
jgi:hypothetical protein